jgi:hypothetical protein
MSHINKYFLTGLVFTLALLVALPFASEARTQGDAGKTVTVYKFVDGVQATSTSLGAFPMNASITNGNSSNVLSSSTNYFLENNNSFTKEFKVASGTTFTTHEILNSMDESSPVYAPGESCSMMHCAGDVNSDGFVDDFDLSIVKDNWGAKGVAGDNLLGDVNHDEKVDGADVGIVLAQWGPCSIPTYNLAGYSYGSSIEEAMRSAATTTPFTFNNPQSDIAIIVWNNTCVPKVVAPICDFNINLLKNGNFEDIQVQNDSSWDIYNVNDNLGWIVSWFGGERNYADASRPSIGLLEIQNNFNGWVSQNGSQHAELDSDWDGPEGDITGEPASVKIYQDVQLIPGRWYELTFYFSPTPNTVIEENHILVEKNDALVFEYSSPGFTQTFWTNFSTEFIAEATTTRFAFKDMGIPNAVGTLVDNVILRCLPGGPDGE